jgi:hypothetical protein
MQSRNSDGRLSEIDNSLGEEIEIARLIFFFFIKRNFLSLKEGIEATKLVKSVLKGELEFGAQNEVIQSISGKVLQFVDLISQQYKVRAEEIVDQLPFTPEEIEIVAEDD